MNNVLFISYDFHEKNKPIKSVAIATLESYLKEYTNDTLIDTFSFNMNDEYSIRFNQMATLINSLQNKPYNYICISLYAWSKRYINELVSLISDIQPSASIVLGGYEVNKMSIESILIEYPLVDHFIIGYAEESIRKLIAEEDQSRVLNHRVDNLMITPVYSNGVIDIKTSKNVRIETKRGCPYSCSFCSYKSNDHKQLTTHELHKVKQELKYLHDNEIEKVNVLDPIFTMKNFVEVLRYLVEINFRPRLSLQVKFELLYGIIKKNKEVLQLLSQLDIELEFGLQSISSNVLKTIERTNDLNKVDYVISQLNQHNISYEISIIRGLPGETLETYKQLLQYLSNKNCSRYVCYPLTLLTNTKLHTQKELLNLHSVRENGLEYVVSTSSYTYEDYLMMIQLENQMKREIDV